MRSFRRLAVVVSVVGLGCGSVFALGAGCSSNGSTTPAEGGADGSHDGTVDAPTSDTSHPDVVESGSDGDAGSAGDVVITVDSGDASALYEFPGQLAAALCGKLQQCCAVESDAGFDLQTCTGSILPYGWEGSSFGNQFVDGGKMTLNLGSAQACLQDVANIDCSANVITSTQATLLYNDCFGAMQGTAAASQPCLGSAECAPGNFCALPNDGGTVGSCAALKTSGQPCGDYGDQPTSSAPTTPGVALALSECSYLGSGSNGLSCQIYTLDAGVLLPPSQWSCFQQESAGAGCNFDVDCTSRRCDPNNFDCVTAVPAASPSECAGYIPKEAGAD